MFEWLTNFFHVAGGEAKDSTHDHKTWKLEAIPVYMYIIKVRKYRIMKKKLTVIPI